MKTLIAAALTLSMLAATAPARAADDLALTVAKDESVATVLVRYTGKGVAVTLRSGKELSGVVRLVGDHVLHLGELRGQEFYDAVVPLDEIAAMVVRVRSR